MLQRFSSYNTGRKVIDRNTLEATDGAFGLRVVYGNRLDYSAPLWESAGFPFFSECDLSRFLKGGFYECNS